MPLLLLFPSSHSLTCSLLLSTEGCACLPACLPCHVMAKTREIPFPLRSCLFSLSLMTSYTRLRLLLSLSLFSRQLLHISSSLASLSRVERTTSGRRGKSSLSTRISASDYDVSLCVSLCLSTSVHVCWSTFWSESVQSVSYSVSQSLCDVSMCVSAG